MIFSIQFCILLLFSVTYGKNKPHKAEKDSSVASKKHDISIVNTHEINQHKKNKHKTEVKNIKGKHEQIKSKINKNAIHKPGKTASSHNKPLIKKSTIKKTSMIHKHHKKEKVTHKKKNNKRKRSKVTKKKHSKKTHQTVKKNKISKKHVKQNIPRIQMSHKGVYNHKSNVKVNQDAHVTFAKTKFHNHKLKMTKLTGFKPFKSIAGSKIHKPKPKLESPIKKEVKPHLIKKIHAVKKEITQSATKKSLVKHEASKHTSKKGYKSKNVDIEPSKSHLKLHQDKSMGISKEKKLEKKQEENPSKKEVRPGSALHMAKYNGFNTVGEEVSHIHPIEPNDHIQPIQQVFSHENNHIGGIDPIGGIEPIQSITPIGSIEPIGGMEEINPEHEEEEGGYDKSFVPGSSNMVTEPVGAKTATGAADLATGVLNEARGVTHDALGVMENATGVTEPANGVTDPATGVTKPAIGYQEVPDTNTGKRVNLTGDLSTKTLQKIGNSNTTIYSNKSNLTNENQPNTLSIVDTNNLNQSVTGNVIHEMEFQSTNSENASLPVETRNHFNETEGELPEGNKQTQVIAQKITASQQQKKLNTSNQNVTNQNALPKDERKTEFSTNQINQKIISSDAAKNFVGKEMKETNDFMNLQTSNDENYPNSTGNYTIPVDPQIYKSNTSNNHNAASEFQTDIINQNSANESLVDSRYGVKDNKSLKLNRSEVLNSNIEFKKTGKFDISNSSSLDSERQRYYSGSSNSTLNTNNTSQYGSKGYNNNRDLDVKATVKNQNLTVSISRGDKKQSPIEKSSKIQSAKKRQHIGDDDLASTQEEPKMDEIEKEISIGENKVKLADEGIENENGSPISTAENSDFKAEVENEEAGEEDRDDESKNNEISNESDKENIDKKFLGIEKPELDKSDSDDDSVDNSD